MRVNTEDIPKNTYTPILTYCRKLLKDGYEYSTKLEIFRKNKPDPDVIVHSIGDAAKLAVKTNTQGRPVFVKFENRYPDSPV